MALVLASSRARWLVSAGAAMVTTPTTDGMCCAACKAADPPSEWPISRVGGSNSSARKRATATRSETLEVKLVSAKSPSLSPRPVKSKRSTAMRWRFSVRLMCEAALMFLVQVKQWAKMA